MEHFLEHGLDSFFSFEEVDLGFERVVGREGEQFWDEFLGLIELFDFLIYEDLWALGGELFDLGF